MAYHAPKHAGHSIVFRGDRDGFCEDCAADVPVLDLWKLALHWQRETAEMLATRTEERDDAIARAERAERELDEAEMAEEKANRTATWHSERADRAEYALAACEQELAEERGRTWAAWRNWQLEHDAHNYAWEREGKRMAERDAAVARVMLLEAMLDSEIRGAKEGAGK